MTGRTCVGVIGGSLATIAQAYTNQTLGNFIWIQSGTYTQTTNLTANCGVTKGYETTHGDLDFVAWATLIANAPLITTATSSIGLIEAPCNYANGPTKLQNIIMTCTAGTCGPAFYSGSSGSSMLVLNVKISGFNGAIDGSDGPYSYNTAIIEALYSEFTGNSGGLSQDVTAALKQS